MVVLFQSFHRMLPWLAALLLSSSLVLACPVLGPGGEERRAAGAPLVVRALLTQVGEGGVSGIQVSVLCWMELKAVISMQ